MERKKLIYIMGCGRSGSTILGFILNNGEGCLDLGEAIDFLERKGKPNGFGAETENGAFWNLIKADFVAEVQEKLFQNRFVKKIRSLEYHTAFPFVYIKLVPKHLLNKYKYYINTLYRCISTHSTDKFCYIDSSKYPGRALLMFNLLENFDLYVIYLVRDPVGVVNSMQNKDNRQGYKNFFSANLYVFIINLFSFLVKRRLGSKCLRITYEQLLSQPEKVIDRISVFTGVDMAPAIKRVTEGLPLSRGYIFNGNRMRMQKEVVLKREPVEYANNFKNSITRFFNYLWY